MWMVRLRRFGIRYYSRYKFPLQPIKCLKHFHREDIFQWCAREEEERPRREGQILQYQILGFTSENRNRTR